MTAPGKLVEQFGIEYEAHNALADAETCAKVIFRAVGKMLCNTKNAEHDVPVTALLDACGLTMKTL